MISIFFLGLEFALHDFGFRGVSSVESAGIGGAAHLVNFLGTDTLAAILTAKKFYAGAGMAGHSIPATEHSTMTTWGRQGERGAVENVMKNIPTGGLAIVVDSYDIWNMLDNIIGDEMKAMIASLKQTWGPLPQHVVKREVYETLIESLEHYCSSEIASMSLRSKQV